MQIVADVFVAMVEAAGRTREGDALSRTCRLIQNPKADLFAAAQFTFLQLVETRTC